MESDKKSFYLVFAYPTASGTAHVGHMRSYTFPDIIARYQRLKGKNVFFPSGLHATGVDCENLFQNFKENPKICEKYGLNVEDLAEINSPFDLVKYLERRFKKSFKDYNLSLDYDCFVTTVDEPYKRFIQWQIKKLREKGYIIKKNHRLPWCPNCEHTVSLDPAEADLKFGGTARIVDYALIKFAVDNEDNVFAPIGTLRSETIFGATNLWISKNTEYIKTKINGEYWIISKEALANLRVYDNNISIEEKIDASELERLTVINPVNLERLPIIATDFVKPEEATGVVMSVPAHDPYDFINVKKFLPDANIKIVVNTKKTLEELIDESKQTEKELEQILKKHYSEENRGTMLEFTGKYAGMKASEARKELISDLIKMGKCDILPTLSEPVRCRCGTDVTIKIVKGQWFIDYSNPKWKKKTKHLCEGIQTYPNDYKDELLNHIIDWIDARPCTRKHGMGTEFPLEEGWLVEALADSTMYMAFFPIMKYYNNGKLKIENLTDEFFDYLLLDKGEVDTVSSNTGLPKETLLEIKDFFEEVYPLDLNAGGIEHKAVHFPFFLFTHAALLDEKYFPKSIFLNWHVVVEGEKMSKSKGNVVFWDDLIKRYKNDQIRYYITASTNQWSNFDWQEKELVAYANRYNKLVSNIEDILERVEHLDKISDKDHIDEWLLSKQDTFINEATKNMENYNLRNVLHIVAYEMTETINWYLERGGSNKEVAEGFVFNQLAMLTPFLPETVEDLSKSVNLSIDHWPESNGVQNKKIEMIEDSIKKTIEDINNVKRISSGEHQRCILYVVSEVEKKVYESALPLIKDKVGIPEVMVYQVNEKNVEDPLEKSKKAKFCRPGLFLD